MKNKKHSSYLLITFLLTSNSIAVKRYRRGLIKTKSDIMRGHIRCFIEK